MLQKNFGLLIAGASLLALLLLGSAAFLFETDRREACELSCGSDGQCGLAACPYLEQRSLTWLLWGAAVLVGGLGGSGIYLALQRNVIEQRRYDLTGLSDEEKAAFKRIRESGGIFQNRLAKELAVSSVKMTRLLDALERHDLIERKRRGMTNWIVLK